MKIQSLRGMHDLLPGNSEIWQYLEKTVADVLSRYSYQEIRFPILEQTELFKRSVGEATDIVEKEMYSFEDRNGDQLSLRPEGTAGSQISLKKRCTALRTVTGISSACVLKALQGAFAPVRNMDFYTTKRSDYGTPDRCSVMNAHKKDVNGSSIKLV